jgi:hypothetical protein
MAAFDTLDSSLPRSNGKWWKQVRKAQRHLPDLAKYPESASCGRQKSNDSSEDPGTACTSPFSSCPDRGATDMPCALLDAHAIAQRKIGSAPSCLRSAAWLHLNLGAVLFQPGDKACSDIASTYRKERSPTRNALASELPFTFFEARGINSAIVVYVYACMSRSTCDKPTLGSWRGTWLRRPRKRRRQRRRPPRRRSNLRRHTVLLLRHIKALARFSHREPISPLLDVIQGHQYPGRTTTRDMC